MVDVSKEDRCIAITQSGERCSRVAKDGRFCFQHDSDAETIDEGVEPESQQIFNMVADRVDLHPEQLQGVEKDIAQNLQDIYENARNIPSSAQSLDFQGVLKAFKGTTTSTAPTPAKYALLGGGAGATGGPLGMAVGSTTGAAYGVYKVWNDDRAVQAQIVEEEPADAAVVPNDHEAIADVKPIQMAIRSAIETSEEQTGWLRTTIFRERDMDGVESALSNIPGHQNPQGITKYYIRHQESDEVLLLLFGEPVDE